VIESGQLTLQAPDAGVGDEIRASTKAPNKTGNPAIVVTAISEE